MFVLDPDYGDKIADFTNKYEACKGAIGILVAKFPFTLSTNNCVFD